MIDDNPSENSAPTATPPSSYRASIKLNCDDDELSSCKYDISPHTDKESSPRLDLTLDIKEDFPGVNPTPSYLHIHGPSLFQCTHGCFNDKKNWAETFYIFIEKSFTYRIYTRDVDI